ncbi:hypothetical protein BDY19DRAFT_991800 [Irpex rosettiformis]|uniref:Uncharacterized protein n=1 Tax=Irpex rosettiformis TaxID=378272 RepID=A0ACB8UAL2_9APHY|nr:hypothetical protein BDY19DRAFT_991800 [Irpex rosettiformis]
MAPIKTNTRKQADFTLLWDCITYVWRELDDSPHVHILTTFIMAQESEDFVIKRRRRRSHITFSSSSPLQEEKSSKDITQRTYRIQSQTRKREDTAESPVTVEDFLRWSASTPTGRVKKKRRYIDINTPNQSHGAGLDTPAGKCRGGSSSDHERVSKAETSTDGISSSSPLPRQKPGTLSERMLRAAALSHVHLDPVDALAHIAHPDRPTLKFEAVPSSTLESRSQFPAKKKWRLVDPRRTSHVGSVFPSSLVSFSASTGSRKSVGHWRPPDTVLTSAFTQNPLFTKRGRKAQKETLKDGPGPTPLTFVPIDSYGGTSGPSVLGSCGSRTQGKVVSPSSSTAKDAPPSTIAGRRVLAYDSDPPLPSSSNALSSPSIHANDLSSYPGCGISLSATFSRLSRAPTLTQKPLKPFDSFLDGLMETARHTTAIEKSKSQRRSFREKSAT